MEDGEKLRINNFNRLFVKRAKSSSDPDDTEPSNRAGRALGAFAKETFKKADFFQRMKHKPSGKMKDPAVVINDSDYADDELLNPEKSIWTGSVETSDLYDEKIRIHQYFKKITVTDIFDSFFDALIDEGLAVEKNNVDTKEFERVCDFLNDGCFDESVYDRQLGINYDNVIDDHHGIISTNFDDVSIDISDGLVNWRVRGTIYYRPDDNNHPDVVVF